MEYGMLVIEPRLAACNARTLPAAHYLWPQFLLVLGLYTDVLKTCSWLRIQGLILVELGDHMDARDRTWDCIQGNCPNLDRFIYSFICSIFDLLLPSKLL